VGVARRFMNVTYDEPGREHLLMFIIGGDQPQAEFTPAAMAALRGLAAAQVRDATKKRGAGPARRCAPGCCSQFRAGGCATYYAAQLDRLYGPPSGALDDRSAAAAPAAEHAQVSNILEHRWPCATAATMRRASSTWLPTKA